MEGVETNNSLKRKKDDPKWDLWQPVTLVTWCCLKLVNDIDGSLSVSQRCRKYFWIGRLVSEDLFEKLLRVEACGKCGNAQPMIQYGCKRFKPNYEEEGIAATFNNDCIPCRRKKKRARKMNTWM